MRLGRFPRLAEADKRLIEIPDNVAVIVLLCVAVGVGYGIDSSKCRLQHTAITSLKPEIARSQQ